MTTSKIDLSTFKFQPGFYGKLDLVVTVKSFDLQAIRARYLASKGNKSGKTGSVERRAVALGGIAAVTIEDGQITREEVLAKVKEPRGIASTESLIAVSSENEVFVIGESTRSIQNDWFSYIHTVDFSKDGERLLVSSSGLDCIFEYELESGVCVYEWFAWENGFNSGVDPKTGDTVTLSRYPIDGINVKVILDPLSEVLPTAMRAAFINSVEYDKASEDSLLATFFHEGKVYRINKNDGTTEPVIEGMKNPHGGGSQADWNYATSTGTGEVVVQTEEEKAVYTFEKLAGKPEELGDMEWLQNSKFDGDTIITIDSNRTSFVIFDPKRKLIDVVPYNDNWAVQDMVLGKLSDAQRAEIKALSVE